MKEWIVRKIIFPLKHNPKVKKIRNKIYAALLILMLLLLLVTEGFN